MPVAAASAPRPSVRILPLLTLQSIETNRLKLSEGLARRISAATGVHFRWLIENDLQAEMITATGAPAVRAEQARKDRCTPTRDPSTSFAKLKKGSAAQSSCSS